MSLPYRSPQAYLNRFFKGCHKFTMHVGLEDVYRNDSWELTHIENETFVLSQRIRDNDTGADYFDDVMQGPLVDCVEFIRHELRSFG